MSSLAEQQSSSAEAPELVLELDTFERKILAFRVCQALLDQEIEKGGDEAGLSPITNELKEEVEELWQLAYQDANKPVKVELPAEIGVAIEEAAESETFGYRDDARRLLGLEPLEDGDPTVQKPFDARRNRIGELIVKSKLASEKPGADYQGEPFSYPQPVHFDEEGKKLPYNDHVELRTFTELVAASRAISAYQNHNQPNAKLPDVVKAISIQDDYEGFQPVAYSGSEARVIYGALSLMAGGLIKNEKGQGETAVNDYDKANARYILKAWKGETPPKLSQNQASENHDQTL